MRLYDRLFTTPNPANSSDFHQVINPNSLELLTNCKVEPSVAEAGPDEQFQFERLGYFCLDTARRRGNDDKTVLDGHDNGLTFNRTVTLRDSWTKQTGGGRT